MNPFKYDPHLPHEVFLIAQDCLSAPNLMNHCWFIAYNADLHDRRAHAGPSERLAMSSQAHRRILLNKTDTFAPVTYPWHLLCRS